jgi:putative DNA primase/helicase
MRNFVNEALARGASSGGTVSDIPPHVPPIGRAADDAEVARLARLPAIAYDRERESAAQRLGCRVGTLDERVKAARGDVANSSGQGRPIDLPEPKFWPEAVEGSLLLDALSRTIREYVILSDVQADAVALWSVHTHAHDASDVSPKLVLKSAQKRSGKTRLAQVMERLVAHPLLVSGIRPAALLRIIEMSHPTLLLDEMDALMKQDREMAEALRGIINSGFDRAGAHFIMNVPVPGGGYEPRAFSTWAAQLLSGIGDLPDTVRDRSIEIEMLRKRRDEQVRRLRRRDGNELDVLGQKSARWARDKLSGRKCPQA